MQIGTLTLQNNLLLAPMAGYTDLPFRLLVKRCGAGMVFTEMVSAHGLVYSNGKTGAYLATTKEEFPLSAQIFGVDECIIAEAARCIQERGIAAIDLNMGCPVRKVVKKGAGAALMNALPLAQKIIKAVRKAVTVPVTVKIRSGWDSRSINCGTVAAMAQDCGADAIIIHPRTARQLFAGAADWAIIREIKHAVTIPVIGNGDVKNRADALRMQIETGCDGVMIGRGALGQPWIFQQGYSGIHPGLATHEHLPAALFSHIDLIERVYGGSVGPQRFIPHLFHYLKGIPRVKALRRYLGSDVKTLDDLRRTLIEFFQGSFPERPAVEGTGIGFCAAMQAAADPRE